MSGICRCPQSLTFLLLWLQLQCVVLVWVRSDMLLCCKMLELLWDSLGMWWGKHRKNELRNVCLFVVEEKRSMKPV